MIFIEKCKTILSTSHQRTENNSILCGMCPQNTSFPEHVIYKPMLDEMINHLMQSYKRDIPKELLYLYKCMNGADLFWTTRHIKRIKRSIPFCRFSIYGIPVSGASGAREPFNISLEDLSRPMYTPEQWLKFGSYYEPNNFSNKYDLFVDTESNHVFAVSHDCSNCCVIHNWSSIDECLCGIFSLLEGAG